MSFEKICALLAAAAACLVILPYLIQFAAWVFVPLAEAVTEALNNGFESWRAAWREAIEEFKKILKG